jgi:hypothetical protein
MQERFSREEKRGDVVWCGLEERRREGREKDVSPLWLTSTPKARVLSKTNPGVCVCSMHITWLVVYKGRKDLQGKIVSMDAFPKRDFLSLGPDSSVERRCGVASVRFWSEVKRISDISTEK